MLTLSKWGFSTLEPVWAELWSSKNVFAAIDRIFFQLNISTSFHFREILYGTEVVQN